MINKDGYKIIAYTGILLLAMIILLCFWPQPYLFILTALVGVLFIFHFFFFRDPQREIPQGDKLVLAPADGQIIAIDEVEEPLFFKEKARRVAIFMTVFNVHINRLPVSGKVENIIYNKGEYLSAFKEDAARKNERNAIALNSAHGKVLFTQIAGLIARRIVCHLKPGDQVRAGERFGMIKYSSRVDVYLPLSAKINVQLKQWVKGGSSILGEFE